MCQNCWVGPYLSTYLVTVWFALEIRVETLLDMWVSFGGQLASYIPGRTLYGYS